MDLASIVWKQGWYFYKLRPPYRQKDLIGSKTPFKGVKIYRGLASAYKSVAKVEGNQLPEKIHLNLGIQDIVLVKDKQGKDVRIYYRQDLKQVTPPGPVIGFPQPETYRSTRRVSRTRPTVGRIK
jgi:hypothetical protein